MNTTHGKNRTTDLSFVFKDKLKKRKRKRITKQPPTPSHGATEPRSQEPGARSQEESGARSVKTRTTKISKWTVSK